jgi:hypothetical protein
MITPARGIMGSMDKGLPQPAQQAQPARTTRWATAFGTGATILGAVHVLGDNAEWGAGALAVGLITLVVGIGTGH